MLSVTISIRHLEPLNDCQSAPDLSRKTSTTNRNQQSFLDVPGSDIDTIALWNIEVFFKRSQYLVILFEIGHYAF